MHTLTCKVRAAKEPSHTAPDIGNVSQHAVNLQRDGASISTDTQNANRVGRGGEARPALLLVLFFIYQVMAVEKVPSTPPRLHRPFTRNY